MSTSPQTNAVSASEESTPNLMLSMRSNASSVLTNGSKDGLKSSSSNDSNSNQSQRNLYVTHIPPSVTDEELRQLFGEHGKVLSVKLMLDIKTGESRGFAFILFETDEGAHAALAALDHALVQGARIDVRFAKGPVKHQVGVPTRKMFLRNIPKAVREEEIRRFFEQEHRVMQISLQADPTEPNSSTNIAHLIFYSVGDAQAATARIHRTKVFASCEVPLLAKVVDTNARSSKQERMKKHKNQMLQQPNQQQAQTAQPQQHSTSLMMAPMPAPVQYQPMYVPIAQSPQPAVPQPQGQYVYVNHGQHTVQQPQTMVMMMPSAPPNTTPPQTPIMMQPVHAAPTPSQVPPSYGNPIVPALAPMPPAYAKQPAGPMTQVPAPANWLPAAPSHEAKNYLR